MSSLQQLKSLKTIERNNQQIHSKETSTEHCKNTRSARNSKSCFEVSDPNNQREPLGSLLAWIKLPANLPPSASVLFSGLKQQLSCSRVTGPAAIELRTIHQGFEVFLMFRMTH